MGIERLKRGPKPLKRKTETRSVRRTILVFTEGKNSEPDYINGIKKISSVSEKVALNIEIHPEHGVPLTLVQSAIDRVDDPDVDECWCLFDVEWPKHHPNLSKAISLAGRHEKVKVAISNPCFEVWLVLHLRAYSKFCSTEEVESFSRKLDGRPGKSIDAEKYIPLRQVAIDRAEALDHRHDRNGTIFPHNNPSSGMYQFLRAINEATTEQQL